MRAGRPPRRYWFRRAPYFNLACCRIAIVGYQLAFRFLTWNHRSEFPKLVSLPDSVYDPLPILHALVFPWGWNFRPGMETLEWWFGVTLIAGVAALVGLATNLSLVVLAIGSVLLQAHEYSYGDFHHVEAPVLIALAALALSPTGRALSLDNLVRRCWSGRKEDRMQSGGRQGEAGRRGSPFAGWAPRLVGWILSIVYLSAALSKVNPARGLEWLNGYTLQYHLITDGLRYGRDLGLWLGQQHEVAVLLSWFAVGFEATFFLVMIFPRLRWLYLPAGVVLHVGIYLAMMAPFFSFIALYSALIPWRRILTEVRRWTDRSGESGRERAPVPPDVSIDPAPLRP